MASSNSTQGIQSRIDALNALGGRDLTGQPVLPVRPVPAMAQESFTLPTFTPQVTNRVGALGKLKAIRDQLLNETLANNPLQMLAAPLLQKVGDLAGPEKVNILANIGKGAAIGSLLIPDDAAVDPESPIPALQWAGIALGAVTEGALTDVAILKSLGAVKTAAQGAGALRTAASAEKALWLFGQGEDIKKFRQILNDVAPRMRVPGKIVARQVASGAALAGTSEAALRIADLESPEEILKGVGLVAIGAATLGGALAGAAIGTRQVVSKARRLMPISEEAPTAIERSKLSAQLDVENSPTTRPSEAGIGSTSNYIVTNEANAEALDALTVSKVKAGVPTGEVALDNPKLEAMFDRESAETIANRLRESAADVGEKFANSFIYESKLQHLPDLEDIPGRSLADNIRELIHGLSRSDNMAIQDLREVVAPLVNNFKGKNFTEAWKRFERIVVLRDLNEVAQKGLTLPEGINPADVQRNLERLEHGSPESILTAAENHRNLVNRYRQDLIRRGKLEAGEGYEYYFPHQIVEDLAEEDAFITNKRKWLRGKYPTSGVVQKGTLKEPRRGYIRQRLGSLRPVNTDYLDVMRRASRRFHTDNLIDDFIEEVGSKYGLARKDLTPNELKALLQSGRFVRDGEAYKVFYPKGPAYYKSASVDREAYETLRESIRSGAGVDIEDLPDIRDILAVGKREELILPMDLADRLEQFYAPDPLRNTALSPILKATSWWKANTIWWGLTRFSVFQLLGDGTNLLRSNPAAYLQARNGRLDAPVMKALAAQFAHYGVPMMSREQAIASLVGGVGGLTFDDVASSDDPSLVERAASIMIGAGLGYAATTRIMSRQGRPLTPKMRTLADLYDQADELAAINSGFVWSEEEVARRIIGERSSLLPTGQRKPWLRALDTMTTMMSGRIHGDPYAFSRVPAEMVHTFQTERENLLRLASYIQLVESGIPAPLAAKRSRESLVDYGKFTDFENKFIRGFALPFYAFYRHNIPNWVKAAAGRDVGGKAKVALAATAAIAAGDMIAQSWNEAYFPEVERKLDDFRRKQFHIILGNPVTREPYLDKNGRVMVVGWEMPYERALEFFGLARPGYVMSELFGVGSERAPVSLGKRAEQKADGVLHLTGPRKLMMDLLNPIIKEPIQQQMNKDFFLDAPIVPDRYLNTPAERKRFREHLVSTFFRQYREVKRTATDVAGAKFDPLTSAFGLGLPINHVNVDRDLKSYLHQQMDEAALTIKKARASWMQPLDELVYKREDLAMPGPGEAQAAMDIIRGLQLTQANGDAAWRYYMDRGSKGDIVRRWEGMSKEERTVFMGNLPKWARTVFVYYMNYSEPITEGMPDALGSSAGFPGG